jgi:hypothetical protein
LNAVIVIDNVPGAGGAIAPRNALRAPRTEHLLHRQQRDRAPSRPCCRKCGLRSGQGLHPRRHDCEGDDAAGGERAGSGDGHGVLHRLRPRQSRQAQYASAGIGSLGHLASELLVKEAGLKITHVAY